jgi:hypothetical protein
MMLIMMMMIHYRLAVFSSDMYLSVKLKFEHQKLPLYIAVSLLVNTCVNRYRIEQTKVVLVETITWFYVGCIYLTQCINPWLLQSGDRCQSLCSSVVVRSTIRAAWLQRRTEHCRAGDIIGRYAAVQLWRGSAFRWTFSDTSWSVWTSSWRTKYTA